ncbi:hypothetical protein, partial [Limosilactobacillus reuteri]|uniref:hypothetical protein n=3 Tax=Limosilactobacillus reuteri TaxID=1598 RepID=UPI001E4B3094
GTKLIEKGKIRTIISGKSKIMVRILIFRGRNLIVNSQPRSLSLFLLMSLDLVECVSRANARNKKPPAMRVGDKNYIKKASFALRCRCSSQSQ